MTRTQWISAGAVALLFATGCREREAAQAPAVAESQQQGEQALERAQEAQEQARDQRQEAAGAREEVAEARQDLQEAQQQQQQASQQAMEAQRQAAQQAEQAQQQTQEAREQLAQRQEQLAQPPPGQATGQAGSMLTINGRVTASAEDSLTLRSPAGEAVRLQLNEQTQVFIDGQQGEIGEIPQGAEVRASYQPSSGQEPTALRVDVMGGGQQQQQQQ